MRLIDLDDPKTVCLISHLDPRQKHMDEFSALSIACTMTPNQYQTAAMRTCAIKNLEKMLVNGVMGLCGEAGECIDLVKKHLFQGHEFDREHLAKELGDVAWYLAETAAAIGYNLEDIFQMNIDKLKKRYPGEGFDAEQSKHRKAGDV